MSSFLLRQKETFRHENTHNHSILTVTPFDDKPHMCGCQTIAAPQGMYTTTLIMCDRH